MTDVRIGLIGFGTVGRAFARYVRGEPDRFGLHIDIGAIADSTGVVPIQTPEDIDRLIARKEAGISIIHAPSSVAASPLQLVTILKQNRIAVLVECLPTNIKSGEPGLSLMKGALSGGLDIVTVDKGPMAHGFSELITLAAQRGKQIGYTGTVGARPPKDLGGKRVLEIRGVLNGTTNYVLTEMQERSRSLQDALDQAREEGVAEPDPSLDLAGWDTAAKILILAKSLMSAEAGLSEVARVGIGPEIDSLIRSARASGRRVRLVGRSRIWQGRVRVSVAPKLVGPDSPFYGVEGTSKAATFRTEEGQSTVYARSGQMGICDTIAEDLAEIMGRAG